MNMTRQKASVRKPMLDGGGGIGIVGEGDAVLPLPGTGGTGNEFEGLHTFGPLTGVVEKWGEVVGSTDFKRTQMDGERTQGCPVAGLGVSTPLALAGQEPNAVKPPACTAALPTSLRAVTP
jgi:hypothetical protein